MATIRQRRRGVWEIRVFTGRDSAGRPTQVSRTVKGTKREAQRLAASLESRTATHAAGRSVGDILKAWVEVSQATWAEASRRDQGGRVNAILGDPIAAVPVARLGVSDVELWHSRLRQLGVGETAIRSRHAVLRAALAQAVRWEWIPTNAAAASKLRQPKQAPREAITLADVRAVMRAAREIDPAAGLAVRLAAIGGLRRSELAALRWDDVDGDRLTVDKSVEVARTEERGKPDIRVAPTKTANRCYVGLDAETLAEIAAQRQDRDGVSAYLFSLTAGPPSPDRIGWWWTRARKAAGIDMKWRLHDLRHPERYKQLRTTTVGTVRSGGFGLIATGEWPHYDVVLADLGEETIDTFRGCFGPPFLNPG